MLSSQPSSSLLTLASSYSSPRSEPGWGRVSISNLSSLCLTEQASDKWPRTGMEAFDGTWLNMPSELSRGQSILPSAPWRWESNKQAVPFLQIQSQPPSGHQSGRKLPRQVLVKSPHGTLPSRRPSLTLCDTNYKLRGS